MDTSISLELQRERQKTNKVLELMLETLKKSGVAGAEEAKKLLDKTPTTHIESIKERLLKAFKSYQDPLTTVEHYCQIINRRAKAAAKREHQKNLEKVWLECEEEERRETPRVISLGTSEQLPTGYTFLREPDARNVHPDYRAEPVSSFEAEKKIQRGQFGKTTCFSPATGDEIKIPLEFSNIVSLDIFEQETVRFPLTKTLNYEKTLESYITFSQSIGMSRLQYCQIIKLLIQKEKPSFAFTLENIKDETAIFEQALCLINTEDLKTVIRAEIKNFSRKPGQHLREAYSRYFTLIQERIKGEQPFLAADKIKTKAQRQAVLILPDIINPVTREAYLGWVNRRKRAGEDSNHEDILAHLSDLEHSEEKYCINEEMFPSAQVPLTDVALHHTHHSGDLGADLFVNDAYARQYSATARLQKGTADNWQRDNNKAKNQQHEGGGHNSRPRGGGGGRGGGKSKKGAGNNNKSNNSGSGPRPQQQQQQQQHNRSPSTNRPRSATPYRPHNNNTNNNGAQGNNSNNQGKGKNKERSKSNDNKKGNNNNSSNSKKGLFCYKCERSDSHVDQDCYTYPGATMPSRCRFCRGGYHNSNDCKNKANNSNNNSNQNYKSGNKN